MFFSQRALLSSVLFGFSVFFLLPFYASAQTASTSLLISPASGSYAVGKTFTVAIVVDASQSFNSANATLNFTKDFLSVSTLSKSNSAFSLWAVEPASSNSAGTISFEGGNTTPISGKKTLLEVTFKVLKEGRGEVTFASSSVLAADGKGTDILGAKIGATFTLTPAAAVTNNPPPPPPPPPPAAALALGPVPDAPEVVSPTHPSETAYSSAPKAKFTWDLPPDVTVVRLSLDTKDKTIPTTSYDPAIAEKEFDLSSDGVMYFHLRYKNDAGWGAATHKKIMVDKTPPPDFTLKVVADASSTDVKLQFSATDTLSLIDHYEVSVDGGNPLKVPLIEVKSDGYVLEEQSPGDHAVKVSAFDKAGNSTFAEGKFSIAGAPAAKTLDEDEPKPTDWRLIIDIGLVALIAFLIGYMWYERNAFRHEKYLAKREADELRDNMGNIFAALREEVGEQTGTLFQRPNPSAQDREVMGTVNEAIDLSEELLSKEVEDVRKLLM